MTFDDLAGQEFDHPEYGRLTIVEHNHAGQVFCYDARGRYFIVEADDPALDDLDDEPVDDFVIEFIDFSEALISDPTKMAIVIEIKEDGSWVAKTKNVTMDEAKQVFGFLYDNLSEPYEGRYIAN